MAFAIRLAVTEDIRQVEMLMDWHHAQLLFPFSQVEDPKCLEVSVA